MRARHTTAIPPSPASSISSYFPETRRPRSGCAAMAMTRQYTLWRGDRIWRIADANPRSREKGRLLRLVHDGGRGVALHVAIGQHVGLADEHRFDAVAVQVTMGFHPQVLL